MECFTRPRPMGSVGRLRWVQDTFSIAPHRLTLSSRMLLLPSMDQNILMEMMIVKFLNKGAIHSRVLFFAQKKNGEWKLISVWNLWDGNGDGSVSLGTYFRFGSGQHLSIWKAPNYMSLFTGSFGSSCNSFLMGKVFKFCVLPIQSSDKSPCFYRGGKSSSGTDTFVRSMNAYLPRRLAYPIIVAAG